MALSTRPFYSGGEITAATAGVVRTIRVCGERAVRDVARGADMEPESQIYNWGIKNGTSLDGGRRGR